MKRIIFCIFTILIGLCALTGCSLSGNSRPEEPISKTDFKLDTIVSVMIYDTDKQDLLTESIALCDKYEQIFSRTLKSSELYKLNHRQLKPVDGTTDTYRISEPLAELISIALSYSSDTGNAFDPAIAPLTSLWNFTAEDPQVPADSDIQHALTIIGSKDITLNGQEITLPSNDTAFDLGAIAKGYIADRIKDYLVSKKVKSALISLGGNILCIGQKSADKPFKIGIQKPFADRNETIATMDIADKSVVSSGIYERCFEQNGTLYHHILNPATGYPYDNGLISVTIISDRSVDGDALSTSCFALGLDAALDYLSTKPDIQAVFITDDYQIHYTPGFQDIIPVTTLQNE